MKIYIWKDPYPVSYGCSSLMVVAANKRQAMKLAAARTAIRMQYTDDWRKERGGCGVDRDPDFVFSLPCAIYNQWAE